MEVVFIPPVSQRGEGEFDNHLKIRLNHNSVRFDFWQVMMLVKRRPTIHKFANVLFAAKITSPSP
jgi:hypothetical protein